MTIIEFIDRAPIENMVSCLTIRPDKIYFIGEGKRERREIEAYQRFLDEKGLAIELEFLSVQRHDIESIVETLEMIIAHEEDCVFDLTGGDDLLLVAMGIIYERYNDFKKIRMQKFNIRTGRVVDCDKDDEILCDSVPQISVSDQIILHGGRIASVSKLPRSEYEGFRYDAEIIWELSKEPALHWNSTIVNLMELEKRKLPCDDPTVVELELDRIEDEVANFVEKLERITNLLKRLCSKQLITSLTVTPSSFRYTYKNPDVRECLQKSGNALELITYYAAMSIMNGDQPLINDGAVGVFIDWDGVMHTSDDEEKDTRNEMDLILMRGLVPIFVSCKNGSVQENELYKLNTVAMRFGNVHALKVLVVGSMNDNDTGVRYFKQRAADMGITVIDGVRSLSSLEFAEELRKAFIK